ncbi:MAG: dynamin family protein [bacterium]
MLDQYKELRKNLLWGVEELKSFALHGGNKKAAESLEEISQKIKENRFYLVVLGEFKRGKTTFINALLGEPLLPTAVVPLTSIVTMMKYGNEQRVEVIFQDGRVTEISMEDLAFYVTERGNPGNEKGVKRVEVTYPSSFLQEGVFLVDTPGVGSVFANNTEVTYNFIPKADAAIFLLAADPPISQSELAFLKDVRQSIRKVFFVQNKVDRLDSHERLESMEFSRNVIEKVLGVDSVEVHPLSARMALNAKQQGDPAALEESCLPRLELILGDFLMREKGREVLRSGADQALRVLGEEKFALELELKALETPVQVLEEKLRRFQEEMKRIDQDAFDARVLFEGEIKRLIQELDLDLERFHRTEVAKMIEGLDKAHQEKKGLTSSQYAEAIEKYVHERIVQEFDKWLEKENAKLDDQYAQVASRFSGKINQIIQEILDISSGLFDLSLERFKTMESLDSQTGLYYMVGDPPKFFDLEGTLRFLSRSLLPKNISQKMILRDLKRKLPEIIDRNCGRVRADFTQRLQNSHLQFRWELGLNIDTTREGIEKAISHTLELKQKSQEAVKERRVLLEARRSSLEAIGISLKQCLKSLETTH